MLNDSCQIVGTDLVKEKCIPFVSQYSDCVEGNICSGCTRCMCTAEGTWSCDRVSQCRKDPMPPVDEYTLDSALNTLYNEINKPKAPVESLLEESDGKSNEDLLLDNNDEDIEMQIVKLISSQPRQKRSVDKSKPKSINKKDENNTIRFYHTVDELNKDTLKDSNISGTLGVPKVEPKIAPILSRRTGSLVGNGSDDLSFDEPSKINHQHITDNKIDTHVNETIDHIAQQKVGIVTNQTQKQKDSELSKLIVNELKGGIEHIGDPRARAMSNITFTPENDTLTAMAFIAGNLLNKLWSMEKETSDESLETEVMKQERIADLLDLFKDPLTMRQEEFLKGALTKLSEAIEKKKDGESYSLCEDLAKAKHLIADLANATWEKVPIDVPKNNGVKTKQDTSKNASVEAISKLKEVMSLMNKFENINSRLNNLKATKELQNFEARPNTSSYNVTDNNHHTKNLFGTILEKITKLLLPGKHKKITKKINKQTVLSGNDHEAKKKLKKIFNYNLDNMSLTAKDKLILDYLTKAKGDANIVLNSDKEDNYSSSNLEGDIMMNLSEFFKIKSLIDLMKLLGKDDSKHKTPQENEKYMESATEFVDTVTEITTMVAGLNTEDPDSFANTKNKLKMHLKTILEDLVELQKEKGISTKDGQIKVADALPCIYKLLQTSTDVENKNRIDSEKEPLNPEILEIFDEMKKEVKAVQNNPQARRTLDAASDDRPKSAAVWERVIKNVDRLQKKNFRRISDVVKPKTYEELKKMMDLLESNSKFYKTNALQSDVPAAEQLMLLKTLEQDVKQYLEVLEHIKLSLENNDNLTQEQYRDLKEFIVNAASNLKLDGKVAVSLNEAKTNPMAFDNSFVPRLNKQITFKKSEKLRLPNMVVQAPKRNDENVEFSRDDLLNQLIRNKVNEYLRKSNEKHEFTGINYGIAKNIIENLDKGEIRLARELYKIFVTNKLITPKISNIDDMESRRRKVFDKEPLIQFTDPNLLPAPMTWSMNMKSNDMLRQLLDVKGTRRMG